MATDEQIEREIQDKGLTAPRVTPDSIEAKIKSEFYFTGANGLFGAAAVSEMDPAPKGDDGADSLLLLTFCVLVLENGFTVTGQSAVASPENYDQGIVRKIARADAVNQIWPLEGYLLREHIFEDSLITTTQLVAQFPETEGQ